MGEVPRDLLLSASSAVFLGKACLPALLRPHPEKILQWPQYPLLEATVSANGMEALCHCRTPAKRRFRKLQASNLTHDQFIPCPQSSCNLARSGWRHSLPGVRRPGRARCRCRGRGWRGQQPCTRALARGVPRPTCRVVPGPAHVQQRG